MYPVEEMMAHWWWQQIPLFDVLVFLPSDDLTRYAFLVNNLPSFA